MPPGLQCSSRLPTRVAPILLALLVLLALPLARDAAAHSPHDVVTRVAISPDFADDHTVFASVVLTGHPIFARSTDAGETWFQTTPDMALHGIETLVFSPAFAEDRTAFAATVGGGVHRTTDGGASWSPAGTGLLGVSVYDVDVSPAFATDRCVVAATHVGAFVSNDGGDTWIQSNVGLVETALGVVEFTPDATAIYAGEHTLHRSTDGGATWQPLCTFTPPLETLDVSPASPSGDLIAVGFGRAGGGLMLSLDGGLVFHPVLDLGDDEVNHIAFAPDGSLFAATAEGGTYHASGPFQPWDVSSDGLESLSPLTNTHFRCVAVSPAFADDDTVFVATYEGLYRSTDRGASWDQLELYTQQVCKELLMPAGHVASGRFFLGTYGSGVLAGRIGPETIVPLAPAPAPPAGPAAVAAGAAAQPIGSRAPAPAAALPALEPAHVPPVDWTWHATGFVQPFSSVFEMSPSFATDRTLYYAYISLHRSTDGGESWTELFMPPEVIVCRSIAISPEHASDGLVFLGSTAEGTYRSTDAGETWEVLGGGLPAGVRTAHIEISPTFATDQTVFLASKNLGLLRSTDGGDTWVSQGLADDELRSLAISPGYASDTTVFVGREHDGLYVSTDGGQVWTPANTGLPTGGLLAVESIALSPDFPTDQTLYVALLTGQVYASTNGGASWTKKSDGLSLSSPRALAVAPDVAGGHVLMLSTHDWIYRSTDAGGSWRRLPGESRVDDDHQAVRYAGAWAKAYVLGGGGDPTLFSPPLSFGPGTQRSSAAGDVTRLAFTGDSVTWYALCTATSGIAHVSVDGGRPVAVDLYAPTDTYQQPMFTRRFGAVGRHTIEVTNSGAANPASSGFSYTF